MIWSLMAGIILGYVIVMLYTNHTNISCCEVIKETEQKNDKRTSTEEEYYCDVASFRHALKDAKDNETIVIKSNQIIFPAKPIFVSNEVEEAEEVKEVEEVEEIISERLAELLL